MDWKTYLDDSTAALRTYRAAEGATHKAFGALHQAALDGDALDVKTRELIALGIGISKQCLDCIGFHVRAAIKAGATREEVSATISVAVMMGGGPATMYGSKALEAFDQLSA